jgi:hypothetical protein
LTTGGQENDSKTARAEKKATEEIRLREQKEKEIQDLQIQVASQFSYHAFICRLIHPLLKGGEIDQRKRENEEGSRQEHGLRKVPAFRWEWPDLKG